MAWTIGPVVDSIHSGDRVDSRRRPMVTARTDTRSPIQTMSGIVTATLQLYRDALQATVRSFIRGWMTAVAVTVFAILMVLATEIARPLGILGGFILGAVNALLIGATLSLIEEAVLRARAITFQDIWDSFGAYFWDVIGVGFVLWIPMMLLDKGMATNPNGQLVTAAILLLLLDRKSVV